MTKNELIINNYDTWIRSDLQAYVEAYCITTGEDTEKVLEEIDRQLKTKGAAGIMTTPIYENMKGSGNNGARLYNILYGLYYCW